MIDNNNLIKYFVRVPVGTSFNGAQVSNANATNQKKIYFDENTQQIWVKGKAFSLDTDNRTALATLIGADTNKSVRTIAGEVVTAALGLADADTVINTLTEVLAWFHDLPEGDDGALELVSKVGKPGVPGIDAIPYVNVDEYNNAKGTNLNADEYANLSDEEKIKTPAVPDVPATGLYKVIEDAVANIDLTGYATEQYVENRLGNLGTISGTSTPHTAQSYIDSKIGNLGNRVEAEGNNPAIPYNNVAEVLTTLNSKVETLTAGGLSNVVIGSTNFTVSNNTATITKAGLQSELFTNTHASVPLTYNYLGVSVSITEENGELIDLKVDPSGLDTRITTIEDFDPWEEYSAS